MLIHSIGRVNFHGFIHTNPKPPVSKYEDFPRPVNTPVAPEEALFRRANAPTRYEEDDFYFANESLPPGALPPSDLLEAVHAYAADYYGQTASYQGQYDYRSMDETALLAVGFLMEELVDKELGETGDLVLVEGERVSDDDNDDDNGDDEEGRKWKKRKTARRRMNVEGTRVDSVRSGLLASSGDDFDGLSGKNPIKGPT